jgi:hypothetical protein
MKSIFYQIVLACTFVSNSVHAQCTPDALYADSSFGVWPDTSINLPLVNLAPFDYYAVLDVKTLTDTLTSVSIGGTNSDVILYIEAFRVNSIEGLPTGFTYIPNQSVWTNGGASPNFTPVLGCVSILASQQTISSLINSNPSGFEFPITLNLDAKIANTNDPITNLFINNTWLSEIPQSVGGIYVSGYKIRFIPELSYYNGLITAGSVSVVNGFLDPDSLTFQYLPNGCAAYNYQWYRFLGIPTTNPAESIVGWELIPGAIETSYDPPALFQSVSYACYVTPVNGCGEAGWAYGVINFPITSYPPIDICVVSVDSISGRNIVVWEKPQTVLIDSFTIYREISIADSFEVLGTQPYSNLSTFIDLEANPQIQAFRYKLGINDTSGVEAITPYHKTIHLTVNQGVGNVVNLIWSNYEGNNFDNYKIYRGSSPDSMFELTTIQSNLNSYTDINPPSGTLYYQIGIEIPICNPTAFGFLESRSNIGSNGLTFIPEIGSKKIVTYPNPAEDNIVVHFETSDFIGKTFTINDLSGRICLTGEIHSQISLIDLSNLLSGIYLFNIEGMPNSNSIIVKN